jgi:AcrR family transcriptional regulator
MANRPRPTRHGLGPLPGREPRPPVWAREAPRGRGRQAVLSRDQIADVALRIADEEGLDAVSIRRIAREIGSGAMSLYHYFDSRDELLELMGDRVAGEMLVPGELPEDWREALTAIARHSLEAFTRHPWMYGALHQHMPVTPNLLRHIEQSAQSITPLVEAGFDPATLQAVVAAVDDFTIGYALRRRYVSSERRAEGLFEGFNNPWVRELLESGEFPLVSRFVERGEPLPEQDRFEESLDALLDGFAAKLGL